eukprot:6304396-Alexandrium_andersonii.AAC.1
MGARPDRPRGCSAMARGVEAKTSRLREALVAAEERAQSEKQARLEARFLGSNNCGYRQPLGR